MKGEGQAKREAIKREVEKKRERAGVRVGELDREKGLVQCLTYISCILTGVCLF